MKVRWALTVVMGLGLLAMPAIARAQSSDEPDVPGVWLDAPTPAGQTERYVGPWYNSQTPVVGARSVTVVHVHNSSSVTCYVGVQFQKGFDTVNICSLIVPIPPKQSKAFCSRSVDDPLNPCSVGVSCSPGLTFDTGHFFVSSTTPLPGFSDKCKAINVDARLFFTRDANDDLLESATELSVVKSPGKTNTGG